MNVPKPGLFAKSFQNIKGLALPELVTLFGKWLPIEPLAQKISKRIRIFSAARTCWLFLYQILSGNISCDQAVQKAIAWLEENTGKIISPNTSGYSQARMRIPTSLLRDLNENITENLPSMVDFHGHTVKVVDGTGISLPDTPENRKDFPPHCENAKNTGFPGLKLVALFSLATGALLEWATEVITFSDSSLFMALWSYLKPGDLILGDRGFCGYSSFVWLLLRGVHSVARKHQGRKYQRIVKRLGPNDQIVAWDKPSQPPKWMNRSEWDAFPKEVQVREITFAISHDGFRTEKITIVTTLLDEKIPASEWIALYRKRWGVELNLRDIKTTMGMDILKCKTPKMLEKELNLFVIAYNLVRLIIAETAEEYHVPLDKISFKATIKAILEWGSRLGLARNEIEFEFLLKQLKKTIAYPRRRNRKNRVEPRARKRRPKDFPLLTVDRHQFRENPQH